MRILVTGATGGLGRNCVEYLHKKGVEVYATGRRVDVGRALHNLNIKFIAADLAYTASEDLLRMVEGVDAVWHCAALSSPWGSRKLFEESNVTATANLLEACGNAGVRRFVHISTPAIYFDFTHRYNIDESFRAKMAVNDYARTKALAESEVESASTRFPQLVTTILRPRAIFGPYDQVLMPRLSEMLKVRQGRMPLPRGGRAVIDMTYVENVVYAMWLATIKDIPSGLAFNITNNEPEQIAIVLEKLFVNQLKLKMQIIDVPYYVLAAGAKVLECVSMLTGKEPKFTQYSAGVLAYDMTLSLTHAHNVLGYVPPIGLDEGISRTASWISQNG